MSAQGSGTETTAPGATGAATLEFLRVRYEAYREQQAAALPGLVPREGLRALYRDARAGVSGPVADPLALLVAHCGSVLPLPPFEVWVEDYLRDRVPYLEVLEEAGGPHRGAPVTVELRRLEYEGRDWLAGLELFREPAGWRGFISFRPETSGSGTGPRTTDIFREDTSEAVRARFRSFTPDALHAFLRSALP